MADKKKAKRRTPKAEDPKVGEPKAEEPSAQAPAPEAPVAVEPEKVEPAVEKKITCIAVESGVFRIGPAWLTLSAGQPIDLTSGQVQMLRNKLQPRY